MTVIPLISIEWRIIIESTKLLQYECEQTGDLIDEHEVYINGTITKQFIYKFAGDFYILVKVDSETALFSRLDWLSNK